MYESDELYSGWDLTDRPEGKPAQEEKPAKKDRFITVGTNVKESLAKRFRAATARNGETVSSALHAFIKAYVRDDSTGRNFWGTSRGTYVAVADADTQDMMKAFIATDLYTGFNPDSLQNEITRNWARGECSLHPELTEIARRYHLFD